MFASPLDIANRALDHLGVPEPLVNFTDTTRVEPAVLGRIYHRVRRAELRRNVWRFAIRRAWLQAISATTMQLVPKPWIATKVYPPGAVVTFADPLGHVQTWVSLEVANLGVQPGDTAGIWVPFFGSPYIQQFLGVVNPPNGVFTPSYNVGDIAYMPLAPGKNVPYYSLISGNLDVPNVPDTWTPYVDPVVNGQVYVPNLTPEGTVIGQYNRGQVVIWKGFFYLSLLDINQNNQPDDSPIPFNLFTTYDAGGLVAGSDGQTYRSFAGSNLGNDPTTTSGHWENLQQPVPWTPAYQGGVGSNLWQTLSATLDAPHIIWPIGSGPAEVAFTKNVFPLPTNFLRRAPQDPKAGTLNYLGGPAGLQPDDYELEGKFLTSRMPTNIPLRFVADMVDVTQMDDMFCEGLACRLAIEAAPTVTGSDAKLKTIGAAYAHFMTEARLVNGIETDWTVPPEDLLILVRM